MKTPKKKSKEIIKPIKSTTITFELNRDGTVTRKINSLGFTNTEILGLIERAKYDHLLYMAEVDKELKK